MKQFAALFTVSFSVASAMSMLLLTQWLDSAGPDWLRHTYHIDGVASRGLGAPVVFALVVYLAGTLGGMIYILKQIHKD